ncbi:hypothetical protein [Microtetraspora sp. NBRC 16547]|uniref:hypothetical protein n=1 Tax=Microtetraspora sp. NBRC 16547 TaxID=3030993 RepID=UPI0024A3404F|nr:hypothetical protein [Microtetraspora sp. NBRC 16547]GLW97577.1 hypothetical protein Misp02_16640 [Microtetraspora sp. NBRC 16547]
MGDARARLRYLHEVIGLLYPPSATTRPRTVLPHRLVPRRLVPRTRWHSVLGRGGRLLVPDGPDTIETYLSEVFGRHVRTVLHVRPARRANRKPILSAHGTDGLLGFVKIGDSARARELVRHESATLRMLADRTLKTISVPVVLHHGLWHDLDVLVVSPLPTTSAAVPSGLLTAAVAEIASLGACAWHGDFAPWNIAPGADGRLLVWDWERFGTGVPLGFDALHHFLHRVLKRMGPVSATRACLAQAVPLLAPFGLSAAEARRTAAQYLITLADRHDRDGHEPLGPASTWLNPLVDHLEPLL